VESALEKTESTLEKTRSAFGSKAASTTEVKEARSAVKVQSGSFLEDTDGPGYTEEVLYQLPYIRGDFSTRGLSHLHLKHAIYKRY